MKTIFIKYEFSICLKRKSNYKKLNIKIQFRLNLYYFLYPYKKAILLKLKYEFAIIKKCLFFFLVDKYKLSESNILKKC